MLIIASHSADTYFSHTHIFHPYLKIIEGNVPDYITIIESPRHEVVNDFNNRNNHVLLISQGHTLGKHKKVSIFEVYVSFTWVAEKSTHCKNGQFSPNACKDTSVMPKQPPKSMIFSSWQLSARARTPSSVRRQHRFREASRRCEQDEATAFTPEGRHRYAAMSYACIYMRRVTFILASPVLIHSIGC